MPDNPLFRRHPFYAGRQYDRHDRGQPLGDCRNRQADGNEKHVERQHSLQQAHHKDYGADRQSAKPQPAPCLGQL